MAIGVLHDAGVNSNQKSNSGGIDIGDLAEVGEHLVIAGTFNFVRPGAQVGGVLSSGEAAVKPKDTNVALMLQFYEHVVIVLHRRSPLLLFLSRKRSLAYRSVLAGALDCFSL